MIPEAYAEQIAHAVAYTPEAFRRYARLKARARRFRLGLQHHPTACRACGSVFPAHRCGGVR